MTELTQEYLDKSLKNLPTKQDVKDIVTTTVDKAVEDLARIIVETVVDPMNDRFDELEKRLDVSDQIKIFEDKFKKLEEVLHVKL